jgi:uncharacterized YigZ family protein
VRQTEEYNMTQTSSSERRVIPAREARSEIKVINSRFIATAAPAFTVDEAKALIARVRSEFSDATHNVPAYVIGHGNSIVAHCHDDGEPSGTAGRPALAVLRGSGLGDVAVVVTRYFGGTKLGTGGLVRAYGDAVRSVLASLPRALKVATHTVVVVVPYSYFDRAQRLVAAHAGQVVGQDFSVEVALTARFPVERLPAFQGALREMSNGALRADIIETNPATIVPITAD